MNCCNKTKSFLSIALTSLVAICVGNAQVQADPIAASGWNVDFILGSGETYASHEKPENANIWFASGLGITPGSGIPASGAVTVSGVDFQLESFFGNTDNVMRSDSATNTLTLDTPGMYTNLSILGSNTGASSSLDWDLVLNFSDGPSSSTISYPNFDNWAGSGSGLNPQLTSNGTSSNFGGQLNVVTLDLEALGYSGLTLTSIDFSNANSAGGNLAVFGLAGTPAAVPEPSSILIWTLLGFCAARFVQRSRDKKTL
jgi:hypothetical protein